MPRLLPFMTGADPSDDTVRTVLALVNDLQVIAIDRPTLTAVVGVVRQLAGNIRARLAADAGSDAEHA